MSFYLPNKETATYFQNGIRSDTCKSQSPFGQGVPMSPLTSYRYTPLFYANASLAAAVTFANLGAGGNFNLIGTQYIPFIGQVGVALDFQRCISFTKGGGDAADGGVINIFGFDDRGVAVTESIGTTAAVWTTGAIITSRKAYSYITNITCTTTFGNGTVTIQPSNTYFGLPYYQNTGSSTIVNVISYVNGVPTLIPPTSNLIGNNFYLNVPVSTISTNIVDPTNGAAYAAGVTDARGIMRVGNAVAFVANNTLPFVSIMYNQGADAYVLAQIQSTPDFNGNYPITKAQYQTQVMGVAQANWGNLNIYPNTGVTTLTPFDIYGVQYPGDGQAYNKLFNPVQPMVNLTGQPF